MKRMLLVVALVGLVSGAVLGVERTAMVIPSSKTLVDLMFDVRASRPEHVEMVSYSKNADGSHRLYVFDQAQWRWRKLSLGSWRAGNCFRGPVAHLVFVGGARVPPAMRQDLTWETEVSDMPLPSFADLLNTLNRTLEFRKGDWKRLAVKYDLVLKDMNWEQRRYGSYGPPASEAETQGSTIDPSEPAVDSTNGTSAVDGEVLAPREVEPVVESIKDGTSGKKIYLTPGKASAEQLPSAEQVAPDAE